MNTGSGWCWRSSAASFPNHTIGHILLLGLMVLQLSDCGRWSCAGCRAQGARNWWMQQGVGPLPCCRALRFGKWQSTACGAMATGRLVDCWLTCHLAQICGCAPLSWTACSRQQAHNQMPPTHTRSIWWIGFSKDVTTQLLPLSKRQKSRYQI